MAARLKRPAGGERKEVDADAVAAKYKAWLRRQPLADRSRDAYLAQVSSFVTWLASSEHGGAALEEANVRDWAVRDYKRHVKRARRWAPASVNQALAAIDNFYRSLGTGKPRLGPWSKPISDGSSGRCRLARWPGTGRSPLCSSTQACAWLNLRRST